MRTNIALPDQAKARLQDLQMTRMAAQDAASGAAARLNSLPRDAGMRDALGAERDKHQHRFNQLSRLLSAVNQFVSQLPANTVLEPVPAVDVSLKSGETLNGAIDAARNEITATKQRLQSTRAAGLPNADMKKLAREYVTQRASAARPSISFAGDQIKITPRVSDGLSLLCWVAPEQLCAALEREIDAQPTRSDALPANERLRRIAELEAVLLELERSEQALLDRAHADGLDVLPRPDASPLAVLGAIIAQQA